MLRFYLRLSATLIIMFIICGFALSALGSTQPIHPALRGFVEGCEGIPQPCWYGIVLGVTTQQEAENLLNIHEYQFETNQYNDNYGVIQINFLYCISRLSYSDGIIMEVFHQNCSELTVGDLMGTFGIPNGIGYGCDGGVYFRYGTNMLIALYNATSPNQFSPQYYVDDIHASIQGSSLQSFPFFNWQGFALNWRYRQWGATSCISLSG